MEVVQGTPVVAGLPSIPSVRSTPEPAGRLGLRRAMGTVTLAWMFGSVWSATTTGEPLTLFAQKLGASNFQFGLLTALPFIASLMTVPGSLLIEATGDRKRLFLGSFYLQRSMWFVIALAPIWVLGHLGRGAGSGALSVFLWLMFFMYASGSLGGPAWVSWMADLVPTRLNGKYFSRRRQWGNLTAVPAAIFVGWFLDHYVPADDLSVLRWCAILFLCCAVFGLSDIHLFQYVPSIPKPRQKPGRLLAALNEPLHDRQFIRYSAYVGLLTFAVNLLGQFATLYLLEQVGVGNMAVQMILVVAPMLGQLLVLGIWGRAADRMGKRPLLVLASIGLVPVGIAWCFVSRDRVWLAYLLSGLGAALWTGFEVV
ncbi:MAG TPA: MFS transporter, partial [Tepidisphaeraceae bacterium]|nr:MFS transporter [Tepidisphaeraceae bacterium]